MKSVMLMPTPIDLNVGSAGTAAGVGSSGTAAGVGRRRSHLFKHRLEHGRLESLQIVVVQSDPGAAGAVSDTLERARCDTCQLTSLQV